MRIANIARGTNVTIFVDGDSVQANLGETVAAALLAAGRLTFRHDRRGETRGLYCNMGTCCECMVEVVRADGQVRPARACLVDVSEGLAIETRAKDLR